MTPHRPNQLGLCVRLSCTCCFQSAVVKAPKSSQITYILRSLHWLTITERTEYKLLSLTYKVLTTTQPSYLHNFITVQPPRSTRSSSLVTLARPSTSSSLWITDRSFQYASPRLWNRLPASLRQPRTNLSNSVSPSSLSGTSSISYINSPLSSSITSTFQCLGLDAWDQSKTCIDEHRYVPVTPAVEDPPV